VTSGQDMDWVDNDIFSHTTHWISCCNDCSALKTKFRRTIYKVIHRKDAASQL